MDEMHLSNDQIMDFVFEENASFPEHFHQNIEIFYLLEGSGVLTVREQAHPMKKDDFIIINANAKHSFSGEGDVLYVLFQINYNLCMRHLDLKRNAFLCDSAAAETEGTALCRRLLRRIMGYYYRKKNGRLFFLNSLYYQLLDRVSEYFLVSKQDERFQGTYSAADERIDDIYSYINSNYKYSISLNDLAQKLYLSPAYLSKYIKRTLGANFKDYLTAIRLDHAVDALYADPEANLTYVAMDNGFPNIAAFTKSFREKYGMIPSMWLERTLAAERSDTEPSDKELQFTQKVLEHLGNSVVVEQSEGLDIHDITASAAVGKPFEKPWNRMVNGGLSSELLHHDMQEHILELCRELGFRYVRIWDLYAPELHLNLNANTSEGYNFLRVERIFDFLVDHGLRPYIELGFKPLRLLNSANEYIVKEERPDPFPSAEAAQRFLRSFLQHFINRYGIMEVRNWYIEVWDDSRNSFSQENQQYFDLFQGIYRTAKLVCADIRVGGAGFEWLRSQEELKSKLLLWKTHREQPDFISAYCYPYYAPEEARSAGRTRNEDPGHCRTLLTGIREAMNQTGYQDTPLHITEWGASIANRDSMNDSCNRSAYLVRNMIDCIGRTELMGYWLGSDLYSEFGDAHLPLYGGVGLLTVDGIHKPSFYAFYFMNQLGKILLYRDEYCIITTNGRNDYEIVCHNYKQPNQEYYRQREDYFHYEEYERLFYDTSARKLCMQVQKVQNGTYQVKTRYVNRDAGSVQDEWQHLNKLPTLRRQDREYLKSICVPRTQIDTVEVRSNVLTWSAYLKPFEIRYIHVTRRG